jgi:hypothetical protein
MYIMLVLLFHLGDEGVTANYLFDGHQEGNDYFMAFETG